MSKREARISNAIRFQGMYNSKETRQRWLVKKVYNKRQANQNYVIEHKHPDRNWHVHGYASSYESAIKKIAKHEEWAKKHNKI